MRVKLYGKSLQGKHPQKRLSCMENHYPYPPVEVEVGCCVRSVIWLLMEVTL